MLAFLEDRLSEPSLRNKVEARDKTLGDVAMEFLRSSAGNFLFVTTAMTPSRAANFVSMTLKTSRPAA